jgi:hypothetical protein
MNARQFYHVTAQFALAGFACLFSALVAATTVTIVGPVAYSYSQNSAVLTVAAIQNNSGTTSSGPLRLELVAYTIPFTGGNAWPAKLAQFELPPLGPNSSYTNVVSGPVPFQLPLSGTWYVSMVLTEYTGASDNDGFSVRDFSNISPAIVVGNPSAREAVLEYYYPPWDAYFITGIPAEIAALDAGQFPGWERTGYWFAAYDPAASQPLSSVAVCRFFNVSFAPRSSHFYALHGLGCEQTLALFPDWSLESANVFGMVLPDGAGRCPATTSPSYRLSHNGQGGAPHHRYTPDLVTRTALIDAGWTPEGYGIGVAFCSP